jgi:hypothetical protein
MNYINGDKFIDLVDYTFSSTLLSVDDYNRLPNTFDLEKIVYNEEPYLVYCHTMYKDQFFDHVKNFDQKIVLITHNSDVNINKDNSPPQIIKWFTQNVNVNSPKIESLPIGLENTRWFPHLQKMKLLQKYHQIEIIKEKLVYVNHNINTNPQERNQPYQILGGKKWSTLVWGRNGQNFDRYIQDLARHKFVISPEGNGIDTHRKWEALYVGTYPIEKRNINNTFYEDLPILIVDDWSELTQDFLEEKWLEFQKKEWNWEKLTFEYWQNKIYNHE